MQELGIAPVNRAAPTPFPSRGQCDAYPWDLDPSQRFTRSKTGIDPFVQYQYNTSAPGGWLGGIFPFTPLIEQYAYIRALLRGQVTPGPWTTGGVAVERSGGIPWQTSQQPVAALGRKSG